MKKISLEDIIQNQEQSDSIFNDHMRRYLWILKKNTELLAVVKEILKGYPCKDDTKCYILEATGLIKNSLNKPEFSCELYRDFFDKHL